MSDPQTTEVFVTHAQLAAEIANLIGQGQGDGWFYAMTPKIEKLLKKYGHRLEKLDDN